MPAKYHIAKAVNAIVQKATAPPATPTPHAPTPATLVAPKRNAARWLTPAVQAKVIALAAETSMDVSTLIARAVDLYSVTLHGTARRLASVRNPEKERPPRVKAH